MSAFTSRYAVDMCLLHVRGVPWSNYWWWSSSHWSNNISCALFLCFVFLMWLCVIKVIAIDSNTFWWYQSSNINLICIEGFLFFFFLCFLFFPLELIPINATLSFLNVWEPYWVGTIEILYLIWSVRRSHLEFFFRTILEPGQGSRDFINLILPWIVLLSNKKILRHYSVSTIKETKG